MNLAHTFRTRLASAIEEDPRPMWKIAYAAGYCPSYVGAVKNGHKGNPTVTFIETMAHTLNRDPAWMLGMELKEFTK